MVRIDITNFQGNFKEEEGIDVKKVPRFALHLNGENFEYGETFHKNFILHFINRKLFPVVLLKTQEDIENFINMEKEWKENTPFYREKYYEFGEYFPQFRKVTRVIAFVKNKNDFKDEMKQLSRAAFHLSDREDLRVAKVTNPDLVTEYKKMYDLEWFSEISSNSIVMLKKDYQRSDLITYSYDLNIETMMMEDWINEKSLEPLEEVSGFAFKIISQLKKPMFMAFINRDHPEYGKESVELFHILEDIAKDYPGYIFTYTEDDRYRETKKGTVILF